MATELPAWYGLGIGSDISESASFEDDEAEEGGERDIIRASVFGTLVIGIIIAAAVAGMAASDLPLWSVVLAGLAGGCLVAWGLFAAWETATSEEPQGATAFTVMLTAGIGDIVVLTVVIGGLVAVFALVIGVLAAGSSGRR